MNDYEQESMISTNMGSMPLSDYLDIKAMNYGFDSYKDMRKAGYCIDIPEAEMINKFDTDIER